MTWKTFHDVEKLARWCLARRGEIDAASFDIFDTILVRRIHDPDLVKLPVARFIAGRAAAAGLYWPAEKVLRFRNRVEAMHRRRNGRSNPDHEAAYLAFMADVLGRIFRDGSPADRARLLEEVTDYELGIESGMLVPRAAIVECMKGLRQAGVRIYAISDMYLPATHLRRIIERAGLGALVDGVISSADTFRAKASGAAWPLVREKFKLDPARWLHVGDNPISDGQKPAEYGIRAAVLRDTGEIVRKQIARTYWTIAARRPYWRGRLVQQLCLPLEAENQPRDPLYIAGHNLFAPFLCGLIQHVAEQCRARDIRRVYFFSREGELLKQVWEAIAPALFPAGDAPAAHYLYVSRMALAGPSCAYRGLDQENAAIAFLPAASRDLRDLARVYGLDAAALAPLLARHGLRIETPLSRFHAGWDPANGDRFRRTLDDPAFQAEIKRQTREANEALQQYLADEHFFDQPDVAVVDIGWLGTIQRYLHQAVAHRPDHPRMHGFVLALAGSFPFPAEADNRIEGYAFDRTAFDFAGSLIMYARELFEEVARAPHPGLMAYRLRNGKCELEFRPDDDAFARNEAEQSAYFTSLRQGVLAAAGRYAAAVRLLDYTARDLKPWLNVLLVSRIAFPRASEVELLRHVHHMDDFAGAHQPTRRFRKVQGGAWHLAPWRLRLNPFRNLYEFAKHAVCMLRQ